MFTDNMNDDNDGDNNKNDSINKFDKDNNATIAI